MDLRIPRFNMLSKFSQIGTGSVDYTMHIDYSPAKTMVYVVLLADLHVSSRD